METAGTRCSQRYLFTLERASAEPKLTLNLVAAVLAAGAPEQSAFMSDEAMESVPGLKPIQYTAKHYDLYLDAMMQKTQQLNEGEAALTHCSVFVSIIIVTIDPRCQTLVCRSSMNDPDWNYTWAVREYEMTVSASASDANSKRDASGVVWPHIRCRASCSPQS